MLENFYKELEENFFNNASVKRSMLLKIFFSKEMIKNRDEKTLEMIFYSIGLNPKEYLDTG